MVNELLCQLDSGIASAPASAVEGAGPFTTAALAIVVTFVVSIVGSAFPQVSKWLAPVVSVVVVGVIYAAFPPASVTGLQLIVTAFVNAVLVCSAAIGVNTIATSGKPPENRANGEPKPPGRWF